MAKSTDIRVGIVEDHPVFLDLLSSALDAIPGITVSATAQSVGEAKKWFRPEELDVLVLDIELPDGNGVGLGVQMRRQNPNVGLVFFSDREMLELVLGLPEDVRAGCSYLSKSSTKSIDTLLHAIRLTARGETIIDPTLVNRSRARVGTPAASLTDRQFEILRAVARGESNQGIADQLGIAANSVGNHLIAIYDVLGIPEGKNARVAAVLEFLEDTTPSTGISPLTGS